MTGEQMEQMVRESFDQMLGIFKKAQLEYAHGNANPFRNFEGIAAQLRKVSREEVLWVYFMKHIDGIVAYLNGHEQQREPIEGRIHDAIIYLLLLKGMIRDKQMNSASGTFKRLTEVPAND